MKEPSESSSSTVQVNSQTNYKYDQFGFVLVNTIEDLLYDKFNNYMGKDLNEYSDKNDQIYNGNYINFNRNCKSIDNNKAKEGDKSMRLVLKINNKDKKAFRIFPNDSRSIESITLKDKESDLKNCFTNKSNKYTNSRIIRNTKKDKSKKDEMKKKSYKKKRKKKHDENNYDNNDQFTFCEEENESDEPSNRKKKKKMIKENKKIRKKENDSQEEEDEEEEEEEDDSSEEDTDNKKKKIKFLSRPVLSKCIMTKIRRNEPDINQVIPKTNRTFITKIYGNSNKKKNKTKILTWPNSTLCYFYKNNKIIHMNIHIPLQNVVNKNYFCTKEITDTNDPKYLEKIKKEETPPPPPPPPELISPNVVIKIINPENSPYKYGKINIRTKTGRNSNSKQKTYLFKIRGNKDKKTKNILSDKLSKSNCFRNVEIIKALNKRKKKSKSKKKKEILSPECLALKRRKKFADKIYKKMMQKKTMVNPPDYKISIKTKFRNSILNNNRMLETRKDEEKLLKHNSMNAYKFNSNNIKNIKYPSIRRMMYDENSKNRMVSFNKDKYNNSSFQTLGRYNSNNNVCNNNKNFPAINSYFH